VYRPQAIAQKKAQGASSIQLGIPKLIGPPVYRPQSTAQRMPLSTQPRQQGKFSARWPSVVQRSQELEEVVKISEGEVKTGSANAKMDFGGVTTCMTITCILEDGTKVSAHEALLKRVPGTAFKALKDKIGGAKVKKVIASGGANYWTPDLDPQSKVMEDIKKKKGIVEELSFMQEMELLEEVNSELVSGNTKAFTDKLKMEFGTSNVTFEDYDLGNIMIDSDNSIVH
jgi:hypothetical protein